MTNPTPKQKYQDHQQDPSQPSSQALLASQNQIKSKSFKQAPATEFRPTTSEFRPATLEFRTYSETATLALQQIQKFLHM